MEYEEEHDVGLFATIANDQTNSFTENCYIS